MEQFVKQARLIWFSATRPNRWELMGLGGYVLLIVLISGFGPDNGIGFFQARETDIWLPYLLGTTLNVLLLLATVHIAGPFLRRGGSIWIGLSVTAAIFALGLLLQTAWQLILIAVRYTHLSDVSIWALTEVNLIGAIVTLVASLIYLAVRNGLMPPEVIEIRPEDTVMLGEGAERTRFTLSEIWYLKSAGNYLEVHLTGRDVMVYGSLKTAMTALPDGRFVQIHRSYVVNLDKVRQMKRTVAVMDGGELPVGASRADAAQASWSERHDG